MDESCFLGSDKVAETIESEKIAFKLLAKQRTSTEIWYKVNVTQEKMLNLV